MLSTITTPPYCKACSFPGAHLCLSLSLHPRPPFSQHSARAANHIAVLCSVCLLLVHSQYPGNLTDCSLIDCLPSVGYGMVRNGKALFPRCLGRPSDEGLYRISALAQAVPGKVLFWFNQNLFKFCIICIRPNMYQANNKMH